jgi:hypothetical protein
MAVVLILLPIGDVPVFDIAGWYRPEAQAIQQRLSARRLGLRRRFVACALKEQKLPSKQSQQCAV